MVTASPIVLLNSASGDLTVTYDQKGVGGWCQVHLLVSGVSRPLGAERLKYIVTHLLSFLADTAPDLRCVLSLSERHTSVYGEHVGEEAILHLQDAEAKVFAKLPLNGAEKKQWLETLSQPRPAAAARG
jgi:hypothetical protein